MIVGRSPNNVVVVLITVFNERSFGSIRNQQSLNGVFGWCDCIQHPVPLMAP